MAELLFIYIIYIGPLSLFFLEIVNQKKKQFLHLTSQMLRSSDESIKDKMHLFLVWDCWLVALHFFVLIYIAFLVKPVHTFMARNSFNKSCLIAELLFIYMIYIGPPLLFFLEIYLLIRRKNNFYILTWYLIDKIN